MSTPRLNASARPRRASPEATLQVAIIRALNEGARKDIFWFAVPNGGLRSVREASRFKTQGVVAGVPDLCLIIDGRAHFLELKAPKGRESDTQKFVARRLTEAGAICATAFNLDEVLLVLRSWGAFRAVQRRAA